MAKAEYAIADRSDTSQTIVDQPETLEQLRTELAKHRAGEYGTPAGRIVALIRRPPGAPMWQDIEP